MSGARALVGELTAERAGLKASTGLLDRACYGRDASPDAFLGWRDGAVSAGPDAVIWPRTEEELAAVVRHAWQRGVAVVPYGAGSGVVRGIEPGPRALVVDTKHLDHVRVDPVSRSVEVGAGVLGERLEVALNAHGFTAGHFPSSIYCSTVGGWVAARSAGQLSSRYGKIEDMILAARVVDGTGRILALSRVTDEALLRALVGSEGSLCVFASVTLRIHPLASHHAVMGLAAPDLESGLTFMRRVMQQGIRPSVFRMYDPLDTVLAGGVPKGGAEVSVKPGAISRAGHEHAHMKGEGPGATHLADRVKRRAGAYLRRSGVGRKALARAFSNTWWMERPLTRVPPACLMVMGLEGGADAVREDLGAVKDLSTLSSVPILGAAPGERWMRRRHAVTYKMPPALAHGAWGDTLEVSAAWDVIPTLYREAGDAMRKHALVLAHFSHAYAEGGSIYFTMAGAAGTLAQARAHHDHTVNAALDVFARLGASLSHHHGVGRMKAAHLAQSMGPAWHAQMRRLKNVLDPRGILNPGVLGLGLP